MQLRRNQGHFLRGLAKLLDLQGAGHQSQGVVQTDELEIERVQENPPDSATYRTGTYLQLEQAAELDLNYVADGSNVNDG